MDPFSFFRPTFQINTKSFLLTINKSDYWISSEIVGIRVLSIIHLYFSTYLFCYLFRLIYFIILYHMFILTVWISSEIVSIRVLSIIHLYFSTYLLICYLFRLIYFIILYHMFILTVWISF